MQLPEARETDMYRVQDNLCIGGSPLPYQVTDEELRKQLAAELYPGENYEDAQEIEAASLEDLLARCNPLPGGDLSADVTQPGCQPSSLTLHRAA